MTPSCSIARVAFHPKHSIFAAVNRKDSVPLLIVLRDNDRSIIYRAVVPIFLDQNTLPATTSQHNTRSNTEKKNAN
jgi:hypothetical protein